MLETLQLKRTAFHERTARLSVAQNWRRWAGYMVVGSYDLSLDHEYWAIRDRAALIDVSPLMKYMIEGPDAARRLAEVHRHDDLQVVEDGHDAVERGDDDQPVERAVLGLHGGAEDVELAEEAGQRRHAAE